MLFKKCCKWQPRSECFQCFQCFQCLQGADEIDDELSTAIIILCQELISGVFNSR